ncbi:MAG: MoxR family ATPase, partial [Microbacterium sp.]|nr:MoxR family ATPase [Microbacterium sp.]
MTMTPEQAAWFQGTFGRLVDNVDQAVMGKREVVALVLAAMLAEGHVLLEDAPGTGKTSLAKALAATVQGTSSRIQFTPDLLPSDVTG